MWQKKQFITIKNLTYLVFLFIGLYSAAWIIIGAAYSYPNAEDLSLAALSRDKGIIDGAINMLTTYDGRYTVNLLHGLNPLAFDFYYGYQLMPVITSLLFMLSLYLFLNAQFRQKSKLENGITAIVFTSLFFSVIDLSASLYWMICSFVYIYPIIFFLLFYSSYLNYTHNLKKRSYFLSLVFLFLSIGCCELYLPIFGIFLLLLFLYHKQNPMKRNLAIRYIVVYVFSSLLFITSTGITNRFNRFNSERSEAMINLFSASFDYSLMTFQSFSFIALFLFLLIFSYNYLKEGTKNRILPIVISGIFFIYATWVVFICLRGDSGFATRITSIPVFIAVITFVFGISNSPLFKHLRRIQFPSLLLLLMSFYWFNSSYSHIRDDFKSGKLHAFKQQMDKQYKQLTTPTKNKDCILSVELEELKDIPSSVAITYRYLFPNREESFLNASYEKYFYVDEVILKNDTINITDQLHEIIH